MHLPISRGKHKPVGTTSCTADASVDVAVHAEDDLSQNWPCNVA